MRLNQQAIDRLSKIKWFSEIGKEFIRPDVVVAPSLNEAVNHLNSPEWENVTLEEANEITGYLATKQTALYQKWNDLAIEARNIIKNVVMPKIPDFTGFDHTLLQQNLGWDIVHYLIEDAYKAYLKTNAPLFFSNLITIYESGHIPCGWSGNWPQGQLIVY